MNKWKQYFKKIVAVALMAAMLVTATDWSKVSAATQEKDLLITGSFSFSEEEAAAADNDELFAGYVQKAFLGDSGISLFSTENHTKNLNTDEKSIYAALKSAVAEIAAGTRASTEITLNDWDKTFTYTELGLSGSPDANTIKASVKTAFTNNISISKIFSCLMADCPYEMYWYDKTAGTSYSYGISSDGSQCTLSSLCFKMTVVSAYASTEDYTADTSITGATSTAVANVWAIVTENEGKSDYEKLVAYRDKICELVSYNNDAANNEDTPYGNPWQLIYVFDNDSNTNVVCEGYSKAFQYLCELSEFDGDVICYTVSGYIPGGGHMWNHVTIGDKNYLVDVTNCDAGAIGTPDKLFLKGMTGSISSGYKKTISSQTITYKFKAQAKEMFGTGDDSILNLSADDYVETVDAVQSVSVTPSASSLTWHYKNPGATLTATPTLATGVIETPTYQWYTVSDNNTETVISGATNATYTMESGLPAGTYTYRVYASIGDCKKSADVSVTVKPLKLTASDLEFTSDTITKKYDGTTSSTATVQIKAGVVADEAVRIEGTAEYNCPNVSEADTVTFTPTAITTGNYRLAATETISKAATIEKAPATIDVGTGAYNKVYKDAEFALSDVFYTGDGTLTYTVTDSKYLSTDGSGNPSEQSVDNDKVITVSADGKVTIVGSGSAKIKITATEGTNYNAVGDANAKSITVTVAKAANPPHKPDATFSANLNCITVSDVTLSGDWQWTAETASIRFDSVAEGSPVAATAIYQGADAKHYETTSVDVAITRANHNLSAIPKKDATCTEEGLEAHWKCSRCGKVFADKDGNTETTLEALKISAMGHQWETEYTIDKAATNTTAGSKSIHCAHCDTIKPGSSVEIPKIIVATPTVAPTATPQSTKKSKVVKDDKGVANIKVANKTKKEVIYVAPVKKKAKSITISNTVKIGGVTYKVIGIGDNAFKGCKNLKTIVIKSTKLKSKNLSKNAFKGLTKKTVIKVPKKKYKAYKKLFRKKGLSSKVKIKK